MLFNRTLRPAPAAPAPSVSRRTRWMVYAIVGGLTAGHLLDVALNSEHWPFSNYPMWAVAHTRWHADDTRLRGVSAAGAEVDLDAAHFGPLPRLQLHRSLQVKPDLQRAQLTDLLGHYEARRAAGEHAGPPLAALRLYRFEWDVHPADTDRATPRAVRLLAEARAAAAAHPAAATDVTDATASVAVDAGAAPGL